MVQCIVRYVLAVALGTILFALNQSVIVTPIDMHHCMISGMFGCAKIEC